jgi:deoxyribodipyrimidine photo-lyase
MSQVFWFRRDLRLQDNVALNTAISAAIEDKTKKVTLTYLVDLDKFDALSPVRQHSLVESLKALGASADRKLVIRQARGLSGIASELLKVANAAGAALVHATRAFDPEGIAEQNAVGLALKDSGIFLKLVDSYYAVAPGMVRKPDGTQYKVYTPFYKNWLLAGWDAPHPLVNLGADWFEPIDCHGRPVPSADATFQVKAGEAYALRTFERFKQRALKDYDELRNRADLSGTSHLSHALAHGEIHPRTILAELGDSDGEIVYAKEIAWREFYADVLWHNPNSLTEYYDAKFANMRYDIGKEADAKLRAWKEGRTGFPMVDAGMRQLLADGWMHNRVRMIVASFLVKDLHLEWQQGAQHFEDLLTDFDPASNAHGWQWTAGCGTDASPYYRVFNPILQGYKFDPNGDYVRKYIPELRHIAGADVHEPWNLLNTNGYPAPIVDHSIERDEALARLAELKVQ